MIYFANTLAETGEKFITIGLPHFLVVALILFSLGVGVILVKRNALWMLMGVELILNSAALNFVAFGFFVDNSGNKLQIFDGQIMTIFIIILAAAEAAVGIAIILLLYHHRRQINPDTLTELKN